MSCVYHDIFIHITKYFHLHVKIPFVFPILFKTLCHFHLTSSFFFTTLIMNFQELSHVRNSCSPELKKLLHWNNLTQDDTATLFVCIGILTVTDKEILCKLTLNDMSFLNHLFDQFIMIATR